MEMYVTDKPHNVKMIYIFN